MLPSTHSPMHNLEGEPEKLVVHWWADGRNKMYKLFTLEQAKQLIPQVNLLLTDLKEAMQDAFALKDKLQNMDRYSIAAFNTVQEIHFLFRIACDCNRRLNELGVLLEDVEAGVVHFPSQQGGEVVHLSYHQGDTEISKVQRLTPETLQANP